MDEASSFRSVVSLMPTLSFDAIKRLKDRYVHVKKCIFFWGGGGGGGETYPQLSVGIVLIWKYNLMGLVRIEITTPIGRAILKE